jgi:hypothetical protein
MGVHRNLRDLNDSAQWSMVRRLLEISAFAVDYKVADPADPSHGSSLSPPK